MEGQGVRSTPSASTSSLPRSRNFTRVESDTAAARYQRVTLALTGLETLGRSEARRSLVPVPELSQTEERIVLLVARGRNRQEIAAAVGLDVRTVDWHLLNGVRGSEAVGPQAPTALDNQRRKP